MSFQWFRMWTDAIDDEKLKLLAFEDRWHFVAILCMKRKGILDAPDAAAMRDRKVGAKLGLGDRDRDEVRTRLREVGLIDEDWQPMAWGKRQFTSDADPTALERKRRERKKKSHGRVTRDNRDSHGEVTDVSHRSDSDNRLQSTDSEKNKPPTLRSGGAGGRKSNLVPDEFTLTAEIREWSATENPELDPETEFAKFHDHEFREPHSDWLRAWRRWVREGKKRGDFAKKPDPNVQLFAGKPVKWQ